MRKAKVTYNAPKGDSKVVEMGGVTFYDGQEIELNTDDHGAMISKLEANQGSPNALFDIEVGEEEDRPKRGRPVGSKTRDLKAGIEEGRDHDFEADRRETIANRPKAESPKGADNAIGFTGTSPAPKQADKSTPIPDKPAAPGNPVSAGITADRRRADEDHGQVSDHEQDPSGYPIQGDCYPDGRPGRPTSFGRGCRHD
jgi:hypothetical protein